MTYLKGPSVFDIIRYTNPRAADTKSDAAFFGFGPRVGPGIGRRVPIVGPRIGLGLSLGAVLNLFLSHVWLRPSGPSWDRFWDVLGPGGRESKCNRPPLQAVLELHPILS